VVAGLNDIRLAMTDLDLGSVRVLDGQCSMPGRSAEAARSLGARAVVPIHFEGWTHFTQGADALRAAFAGNQLTDRLALAEPGANVTV
jgi:hypothetical protein